jgi:O-antigen/teichoic acid export membrane protein
MTVEVARDDDRKLQRARDRGVYASYLNFVASIAIAFVLTPVILRALGSTNFGLWTIFSAVNSYLLLADLGLGTSVMKYAAEYSAKAQSQTFNELLSAVLFLFVGLSLMLVLAAVGLASFLPSWFNVDPADAGNIRASFLLIVASAGLALISSVLANVIGGHHRVDMAKILGTVLVAINAILTLVAVRAGLGLLGLAVAAALTGLTAIVIYGTYIRHSGWGVRLRPRANLAVLNRVWPYSLRTLGLGLTSRILYQTDSIVIGIFLGAAAVTPYAIAYKLCFTATYAFSQISSAMFPTFARLDALHRHDELAAMFVVVTRLSVGIMMPIAVVLALFGRSFIEMWVGTAGVPALSVLLLLVAMDFVHAAATPAAVVLQGIGRNKGFIWSETVNAVLNLSLSIVLVKRIGVAGVVLGTLLAHLSTSAWVVPLLACRSVGLSGFMFVRRALLPPLLAAGPALLAAWLVRDRLAGFGMTGFMMKTVLVVAMYAPAYFCLPDAAVERQYALARLRVRAN